ncbi:hypothetical protein BDN72DRAFT_535904 [Pluteus cervinus]|uniref:Uncharacterized protein n=1 Tax=Pluteus cervinus TaxID=181527 RepID=A0ACD3AXM8_9AGAR|nr:hypothetical protein BDN72DRAFT_535904 [Pluteus cervinus]
MNNEEAAIQFGSPPPLPVPPRTRESSTSGHIEHSLHPQSHLTQTQAPLLPAPATYSAQPIPSLDFHNNPRRHIPHSSSIPSNLPHPSHIPPSSIPMQSKPIPSPSPALHGHSNTPSHSAAYPSPASSSGNVPLSSSPRGVGVVRMGTPLTTATTTTATTSSGMGTPSGNSSALPLQVQRQYRVQEQEGSPIPTSATATLNAPIQQPSVATLNTTLPASGTTLNLVSMNPGAINTGVMVNVGTNNPNSNGFQGNMEGLLSPLLDVPVGVPGVVVNRNYPSRNGSRSRRGDQDVQGRLGMQQAQLGNVYESGHSQGQAQGTQQVPVQLQGQGQGQERRVQDQGHTRSPIIPRYVFVQFVLFSLLFCVDFFFCFFNASWLFCAWFLLSSLLRIPLLFFLHALVFSFAHMCVIQFRRSDRRMGVPLWGIVDSVCFFLGLSESVALERWSSG